MTEEICPECGRPFVTNATENGCFGKSSTACKNRTIARLKSRVSLLEDALLAADRMRGEVAGPGPCPLCHDTRIIEVPSFADPNKSIKRSCLACRETAVTRQAKAYDKARERTRR